MSYGQGAGDGANPVYGQKQPQPGTIPNQLTPTNKQGSSGLPAGTGQGYSNQLNLGGAGGFTYQPYGINDAAITGANNAYGQGTIWNQLQAGLAGLSPTQGAQMAQAAQLGQDPRVTAATMQAAQGQAAQGQAASYQAAQGQAALLQAAQMQAAQGRAAQGAATLTQGAQLGSSAQGGYALAGPTQLGLQGDTSGAFQQQNLANILGAQAAGQGTSAADLQLQAGSQQNLAAQLAALGSQRGNMGNAALAARSAADQGAAASAQLNQQMGIQRAQETAQAQQALGSVLGTARGQSQATNQAQAQLTQGTSLANAANAQASWLQNAQFAQQTGLTNAQLLEQTALANQGAANTATGQNVQNAQAMALANLGNVQGANALNAQQLQAAGLANQSGINEMTLANSGALNAANAGNAQLAQNMTGQNLSAANQFGLANLGNAQQAAAANQQAFQQANLANQALAGQYGLQQGQFNQQTNLANQQAQLSDQQLYDQQLMALLGGSAALSSSQQQFGLSDQQLQLQESLGMNSTLAGSFANEGTNNAALTGALLSGIGTVAGGVIGTFAAPGAGTAAGAALGGSLGGAAGRAASDQNLKTGIQGGNPMMDSFLRRYSAATQGAESQDVASMVSRAGGLLSGRRPSVGGAPDIGGSIEGGIGLGRDLRKLLSGPGQAGPSYGAGIVPDAPASPGISSDQAAQSLSAMPPDMTVTSDDNEKSAVMSGNRGMQAFLQQANAQQGAQAAQGGQSNAFMQTGAPPSAQVDRQLPPWIGAAGIQGMGQPQSMTQPQFGGYSQMAGPAMGGGLVGGGVINAGGVTNAGGSFGGLVGGGGVTSAGGFQSGGMTSPAGMSTMGGALPGTETPSPMQSIRSQNGPVNGGSTASQAMGNAYLAGTGAPAMANAGSVAAPGMRIPISTGLLSQPAAATVPHPVQLRSLAGAGYPQNSQVMRNVGSEVGAALSDEREKSIDSSDPDEISNMLDHLSAYSYRYKDPNADGAAPGRHLGVMAQDLEKSDLGAGFVRDTPNGKQVDYGQMAGTQLAATAYLNDRVNKLESLLARVHS